MSSYEAVNLAISGYAMSAVCIVGVVGNLVLILTMPSHQTWPQVRVYVGYLAGCDTVLLCTSFVLYAHTTLSLHEIIPSRIQDNLAYVYLAMYVLANGAFMARIWATIALTADRYIAVCHPLWHRTKKPRYFGASLLGLFSMLSMAYAVPRFFEMELVQSEDPSTNETLTYVLPSELVAAQDYKRYYRVLCKLLLTSLAPFVLLTALTMRIVCTIARPATVRRNLSRKAPRSKLSMVTVSSLNVGTSTTNCVDMEEAQQFVQHHTERDYWRHQQPSGQSANRSLLILVLLTVLSYSLPTVLDLLDLANITAHSLPIMDYLSTISNFLVACHAASSFFVYIFTCPRFRAAICNYAFLNFDRRPKSLTQMCR